MVFKVKIDSPEPAIRSEEPENGGGFIENPKILVPEGEYKLRYRNYETGFYFGSPKVILHLDIVEDDQYAGLPLARFYNVDRLTSQPGRYGNYVPPPNGNLVREFQRMISESVRTDRISYRRLKDKRILGEVVTVKTDRNREPLAETDLYSRISKLIRVLPDDDW